MTATQPQKSDVQLTGVPQTLLLPLLSRARFSQESYSPIQDPLAIQLVESINYNFSELEKHLGNSTLFFLARAYHFDQAIKNYLKKNPNGKIVNLGAGLETAFSRVDNQKLTWIDLDLPEVIELRKNLLPESNRVHTISKSILDYSWIDDVKQHGSEFFFFAGGLLIYFSEKEVKSLLNEMASRFPRSEFFFDTISKKGMSYANKMLAQSNMKDALIKWSLDDSTILERWSSHIQLVTQLKFFHEIKLIKNLPISLRLKMFFYDFVSQPHIIHLKFI